MNNIKDLKNELKELTGTLLLIGEFDENNFPLNNEKKLTDIFYLNSNNYSDSSTEADSKSLASNMHLNDLHKYFKDGVDNIYCNFDEIKFYLPSFIRESLRITKRNIYIIFKKKSDYKKIEKKYKRYKLNCNFYSFDDVNIAIIEANDIIVGFFKEKYYYLIDGLEKVYEYMSDNF